MHGSKGRFVELNKLGVFRPQTANTNSPSGSRVLSLGRIVQGSNDSPGAFKLKFVPTTELKHQQNEKQQNNKQQNKKRTKVKRRAASKEELQNLGLNFVQKKAPKQSKPKRRRNRKARAESLPNDSVDNTADGVRLCGYDESLASAHGAVVNAVTGIVYYQPTGATLRASATKFSPTIDYGFDPWRESTPVKTLKQEEEQERFTPVKLDPNCPLQACDEYYAFAQKQKKQVPDTKNEVVKMAKPAKDTVAAKVNTFDVLCDSDSDCDGEEEVELDLHKKVQKPQKESGNKENSAPLSVHASNFALPKTADNKCGLSTKAKTWKSATLSNNNSKKGPLTLKASMWTPLHQIDANIKA
jgi:hypothetical protein